MSTSRDWKAMLIPYEQAVEELKIKLKAIRNQYRETNAYSPIEFITGRVKKISSIIEKASRRNIPADEIEIQMEDVAGLRIMCQFIDDIYRVVDLLRERDGKDLTILYEKDYIKYPKASGYKSYHVIISYPVHTVYGYKEVLAELQIRTLAMNFWATIEHSLNYKYKEGMPDDIRERLKKSGDAASLLDLEMSDIRKEIINAQLVFEEKSNTVREITNNIRVLSMQGQEDVAKKFQERFDDIIKSDNMYILSELSAEIKSELPRNKVFSDNDKKES